jgi:hypothetical protein
MSTAQYIMPPLSRSFSREVRGDDGEGGGRPQRFPPDPSDVQINVEGAFIVDDESPCSEVVTNGTATEGVYFENKDIRLPHHTAVVSHVAIDVISLLIHSLLADLLTMGIVRSEDRWPNLSISLENRILRTKEAG